MYKNIKIENFRGVSYLELKGLQHINLLVGKNNCGKTTVLESLFLLTGASNPHLPLRITDLRGLNPINIESWETIFNELDIKKRIQISGDLKKPDEKRMLVIKPNLETYVYSSESRDKKENGLSFAEDYSITKPYFDSLTLEFSYKRKGHKRFNKVISRLIKKEADLVAEQRQEFKDYLVGVYSTGNTRQYDLDKRFHNLMIQNRSEEIVEILRQLVPNLKDIELGRDKILYCDIGLAKKLPVNIMGDGFISILASVMNIMAMENGMVFLDEIENGLHYSSQDILWKAIFTAAQQYNVQVFASTHSNECVNEFAKQGLSTSQNISKLFRIEKINNEIEVIDYDMKSLLASIERQWEVR